MRNVDGSPSCGVRWMKPLTFTSIPRRWGAGGMSAMKHTIEPLLQTPRMMKAIGQYAEAVHVEPVVDGEKEE